MLTKSEALKLETLQQLAEGANQDIRTAAIKIITERASQGPTFELLLQDIAGTNKPRRNKALKALKYLGKITGRDTFANYATFKALIDCLYRFFDDKEAYPHGFGSYTNQHHRPEAEQDAMFVLCVACRGKMAEVLRAGLVTRWLAKYPFGGFETPDTAKQLLIKHLKNHETEWSDPTMTEILRFVDSEPEGRRQLRNHGLLGSVIGESPDDEDDKDISMSGAEDGAVTGVTVGALRGRRIREESIEEQALRRRRREAMVLHEGNSPVSRSDIIQRDDVNREHSVYHNDQQQNYMTPVQEHRGWGWWPWGSGMS